MSLHIKFRIWSASANIAAENPTVGEPFWDPVGNRFGVWNNEAGAVTFLPSMTHAILAMQQGQRLSGKDSGGTINTIRFDWNTPNELRIIDTGNGNAVLARFKYSGNTFHQASVTGSAKPFGVNSILNARFNYEQRVNVISSPITTNTMPSPRCLAPNVMLWKGSGSSGNLTVEWDDSNLPSVNSVAGAEFIKRVLKVSSIDAPTSAGVRMFAYDAARYAGGNVTGSVLAKAATGAKMRIRLIHLDSNTVIGNEICTGTGNWEYYTVTGEVPATAGGRFAFDICYVPGYDTSSAVIWRVCMPQINGGSTRDTFEPRDMAIEASDIRGIYHESRTRYDDGTHSRFIATPNIYNGSPSSDTNDLRVVLSSEDNNVLTLSSKDHSGLVIANPSYAAPTYVKAQVAMLPYSAETG